MEDFKKYKLIQNKKTGVKLLVNIQDSANILTRVKARVTELDNEITIADSEKAKAISKHSNLNKERDDLQAKINELEA